MPLPMPKRVNFESGSPYKLSLNQNGSDEPGNTLETPTGSLALKIDYSLLPLRRWVFPKFFPAHNCHFDLKIPFLLEATAVAVGSTK